jgi:hypothetical protein
MNEWTNERVGESMKEWMNEWKNESINQINQYDTCTYIYIRIFVQYT